MDAMIPDRLDAVHGEATPPVPRACRRGSPGRSGGPRELLFDAGRSAPFCLRTACEVFGLTRAEAEVAIGIARGRDLGCIALETHRALETARGLLKRAMSKAGVSKQNALVALLWSSRAGPLGRLIDT